MDVTIADSEGFDLLVRDSEGKLPGKELKAISVKSRVRNNAKSLTFNIQDSYRSLEQEARRWNAEPYFAFGNRMRTFGTSCFRLRFKSDSATGIRRF